MAALIRNDRKGHWNEPPAALLSALLVEVGPVGRAPVALALYDAECKDVALWAVLGGERAEGQA